MIAESARDVPAWSSRSASPTLSLSLSLEKLQSALQKSGIDRATTWPTAEGWSWALERGHTVPVGRSSAVAVWSRWAKSSVRLGSFGVLL